MEQLSLSAGGSTPLKTLQALHQELLGVLQQAERLGSSPSEEAPLLQMQKITGCSRREGQYYLQQARFNLQTAVIQWHNQVLRDYLSAYQATFPGAVSFRQHEKREAAEAMCSQARKAADVSQGFEASMAYNYLRTNFCAICKVERAAADRYLSATQENLVAAVEEYIARHLLPPSEAADPDASLTESGALVTRSDASASTSAASSASTSRASSMRGGAVAGAAGASPVQSAVYRAIGSLSAIERDLGITGSIDQAPGGLRSRYAGAGP